MLRINFKMKPRKFETIDCPHCGRQYLPAEIYMPKSFFGKPHTIVRDVYGQILDYEGSSLELEETYTCDKCGTTFEITAKISFQSDVASVGNIDEEYSAPVQKSIFE